MPFHFCSDELFAILATLPFIGIFFGRLHRWWHNKFHHKCHENGCEAKHLDHQNDCSVVSPSIFEYLSKSEDKRIAKASAHFDEPWDLITQEDVEERFGGLLVDELFHNKTFFKTFPREKEFTWYVIDNTWVKAMYNGRKFVHVIDPTPYPWYGELR